MEIRLAAMNTWFLIFFINIIAVASLHICDVDHSFYKTPGDVSIIGYVDLTTGENCTDFDPNGLQSAQNIITAVDAIRSNNFIPGISIGLALYDTCSNLETQQEVIISSMVEIECNKTFIIGAMIDQSNMLVTTNLTKSLNLSLTGITREPSGSLIVRLTTEVVKKYLMPIDYLVSPNYLSQELIASITKSGICIKNVITLDLDNNIKIEPSKNVLIVANFKFIQSITLPENSTIVIIPLDDKYDNIPVPKNSKLLALLSSKVEIDFNNITEENISEKVISKASFNTLKITKDLASIVLLGKVHLAAHCGQASLCSNLPKMPYGQRPSNTALNYVESVYSSLKMLRIDPEDFEGAVLFEQTSILNKIGTIKIKNFDWALISNDTSEVKLCMEAGGKMNCSTCFNYNVIYDNTLDSHPMLIFRDEAWIAAILSVSSVGIISSFSIALFIIVRICKRDILEGNPGFTFLMLLAIIFMYCMVLPFSLRVTDDNHYYSTAICGFKILGTGLSFALVFSILLSRSLMLASCDEDGGFMSHVNGYLQTVLCFFIAAVQISLTVQFLAMNWIFHKEQCSSLTNGPVFIYLLGYDMFLLVLLVCLSPFIMSSKRNYQEGGYFSVCAILLVIVWVGWITGYIFLNKYAEVFICFGLVGTATSLLVTVLIPRTYLMMNGIVRDHIVSSLPTLAHTASTSVVDVNYRSTQALYDSINGQVNPNYYSERPTTPSTSKMEDRNENPYERYERSPSPLNVTRF